jgi:hypothetical protein
MSNEFSFVLSSSILLPAAISIIRYKSINRKFLPFLLFLWISLLIDGISIAFAANIIAVLCINVYYLFESLTILSQFHRWKLFNDNKKLFGYLKYFFILFWSIEITLLISTNYYNNQCHFITFFPCFYALLFAIFSINRMNELVASRDISAVRNPVFIICAAFIFYYTYTCILLVFWMPFLNVNTHRFYYTVYSIMFFILFISNLFYAYAILQMIKLNSAPGKNTSFYNTTTEHPSMI